MDHPAQGASTNHVGLPDEVMVQAGSHLATYFNSERGRLRIAVPFLREGIALGQPCFLMATGRVLESYVNALEKGGRGKIAEARRSGLFVTAPAPGRTVDEALAFFDEQIATAVPDSDPMIVRIVGDMACVKESFPNVQEMLIFERQLGNAVKRSPSITLCQYDVREFDGPSLLEAIKAHPDVSGLGLVKFIN